MGEREWVRGWEDDEVGVGRAPYSTCQTKETVFGMVLAGLGMQVSERTGGAMGKNLVVRGRSVAQVGGMEVGGRKGGVMGMITTVWVRSVEWVGEMQLSGRMCKTLRKFKFSKKW